MLSNIIAYRAPFRNEEIVNKGAGSRLLRGRGDERFQLCGAGGHLLGVLGPQGLFAPLDGLIYVFLMNFSPQPRQVMLILPLPRGTRRTVLHLWQR